MPRLSRRDLFAGALAAGLGSAIRPASALGLTGTGQASAKFRFAHLTDLHIQPEKGAAEGCSAAIAKLRSLMPKVDFVLLGGDLVMDVLATDRARADVQFKLLEEALKPLEVPFYASPGNHDVYGWSDKGDASDPLYGKKMFEERVTKAKSYGSFDHKGWHFVTLDSIQPRGKGWFSAIDDDQMTWLAADLEKAGKPTVVMTHVPILTTFVQFTSGTTAPTSDGIIVKNGKELKELFGKHKVKAVLQGHTHIVEAVDYLGTQYVTGGAVSGEWWGGPRLGVHPEGFMVYDVDGENLTRTYVPYGWTARK